MSLKTLRIGLLVLAATVVHAGSVLAANLYVGPQSCGPNVTHYATIQAAVNAANPSDVVMVCPGTYPEQVVISIPLTVKGFVSGTSAAAIITVPAAGLVPNVLMTDAGMVAAQVVAKNTTGVKLIDLTIDGTGGGCASAIGATYTAAVAMSNIVHADPSYLSGVMQQLSIQNHSGGCNKSAGVLSEDSQISVDASSIYNVELFGVSLVRGMGKITNNTFESTRGGGVLISNVTGATVQTNVMSSHQYGVRIDNSRETNVWTNTMGPWVGNGVYATNSTGTWVNGNKISATWGGVQLDGSLNERVTSNTITRSQTFGIANQNSRGGNVISGNTINGARAGVYFDASTTGDQIGSNTFLNVLTTMTSTPIW